MPELPEVERVREELEPLVAGRRVQAAWTSPSPKFTEASQVVGATLGRVRRRGKFLILPTDHDLDLVAHLGMTGRFAPRPPSADDSVDVADFPEVHTRAAWLFDDGSIIDFVDTRQFGRLRVVPADDFTSVPALASMGPEALDPTLDGPALRARLNRGTRTIKAKLLDQKVIAGLGNIYADEALFAAGVSPQRRLVTFAQADRLVEAIRAILKEAMASGGSTIINYRSVDGTGGDYASRLRCYGRAGEACFECERLLASAVIGGRSTTWCRSCQS